MEKANSPLSPTIGSEKWGLSVGGGTEEQCWELGRRLIDESAIIGQLRLNRGFHSCRWHYTANCTDDGCNMK